MPLSLNLQSFIHSDASWVFSRVSTTSSGIQGSDESYDPEFNADGRYVFFTSGAANLVADDTNSNYDAFRKDLVTGETIRVSTATNGAQANGYSGITSVSADGRYVFFESNAADLVTGDTNGQWDAFRKDLVTGATIRVSTATGGVQASGSSGAAIGSADGRYVFFQSTATDLVTDATNGKRHIFQKDLTTDTTICLSIETGGTQANGDSNIVGVSADGQYLFFTSEASNLVADDTNGVEDIFRKDLATGEIIRVSTGTGNIQGNDRSYDASISADGRYLVFTSLASNWGTGGSSGAVNVFRKDLLTQETVLVSTTADGQISGSSYSPTISLDGRYVVFASNAAFVADDTNKVSDIFLKDLVTNEITRLSHSIVGTEGNDVSQRPVISSDGRYVAFVSYASNLVPSDTNESGDIFWIDTARLADAQTFIEGRVVKLSFAVGNASSVSLSWGDGTVDTATPVSGSASFNHTFATTGVKSASVTVSGAGQTWVVPYIINLATGTMLRNTAVADRLTGSAAADRLTGDSYTNVINGGAGNDKIWGNYGNDTLTGNTGRDVFVFNSRLGTSTTDRKVNFDTITDYRVKDDAIWLDNAIFKKLGKKGSEKSPAKLNKDFLALGTKALDKNDYLVYNKKMGILSYDADGSGKGKPVEIAFFKNHPSLGPGEFFVI